MLLNLDADEVHLWYVFDDQVTDAVLLADYQSLLSPEEQVRHDRFYFAKDRHQFLVSRALVRTVLSLYAPVPPQAWRFVTNAHGKPAIASAEGLSALRFNLSHTRGLAAIGITSAREIGVDVENLERRTAGLELAERFFAPAEVDQLRSLDEGQRQEAFFDFWTLKEAYIKARGLGLALPLDAFAFQRHSDRPPRITFSDRIHDQPADWQFVQFRPGLQHRLAVAVHRPGMADLTITCREIVPPARTDLF